ncbi:hypothetical protein ABTM60_19440, partial [Acinetobacter baumannii]
GTENNVSMKKIASFSSLLILLMFLFFACKQQDKAEAKPKEPADAEKTEITGTPVTLTAPVFGSMSDAVELNAVSSFLLKTFVKSNANGY